MHVLVGTSGFSYKEWKGPFYPEDLKNDGMLRYYADRLPTVEINNTFYRMPKAAMLEKWSAAVAPWFRFVLKAPQRITHKARLKDVDDDVAFFYEQASRLGDKLGVSLFQLPPWLKKDVERLRLFLGIVPEGRRVALEFRHPSWFDDEVYDVLQVHAASLCITDFEDPAKSVPMVATADVGYLRLRAPDYDEASLDRWAQRIREQPWSEAYVFFKHEDEGAAPRLAGRLMEKLGEGTAVSGPKPLRKVEPVPAEPQAPPANAPPAKAPPAKTSPRNAKGGKGSRSPRRSRQRAGGD